MDWLLNLFTIMVMALSFCEGQHLDSCSVFPKDQYVEVGSSTEVLCQTACVNGRIFWTISNIIVNESLSKTINSTHAVLPLRDFSLPRAIVQCHSRDTQQVLGGATITMYTKPRSISCVFHYEEGKDYGVPQLLTCTWEHHVYPSLKVNYSVLYSSESNNTLVEICKSTVTNCTVKGVQNVTKLFGDDFNITVRAKTAEWEAYSHSKEFDSSRILKINPPQFEVAVFSDHLLVTWNRKHTAVKHQCQVRYRKVSSEGDASPEHRFSKTFVSERTVKIRIEEALDSCSSYRVSACWARDEAPWSSWSQEKTVLTKLNRSHIRLRLWRKVIQDENKDQRTARAMWTDIPSTCRGTFTHTIKQSTVKKDSMEADDSSTTCGNSTCDVSLSRDAHWLTLSVYHDKLLLTEDSVYVPAAGENLPQVTQIQTVTHDGMILVSWRAPNPPVRRYMIDWTHDENQYNWKESADTNATLSDLVDRKPYNITVTPLFDNKTGLGTRALQVCSRVGEPGSISINNVQAEDTSASISWSTNAQDPCSGKVVTYTVFYEAQEGPLLNVTVNHTQQEVNLRSLSPDTQYSFHVVATAPTGMSRSAERLFKTKIFDPNLITKIIACVSYFLLLFSLILGFAVLYKKIQKKAIPNPGLSSVALWPSLSHQNGVCLIQPFANPTESAFDKVYTEEPSKPSTASLDSLPCDDAACDQGKNDADSAITMHESSSDSAGVEPLCSAEESVAFLSEDSSPVSPYRSQSSADSNRLKQQEKTRLTAMYVTLDMFETVQQR